MTRAAKIQRKIVYVIYVRNVWISRKIEYPLPLIFNGKLCIECPEQRKFIGKLRTLYMYEMSGFAEKLIVQNFVNLMGNCIHNITECLDLLKN